MKTEATGRVHRKRTETTANGKTIGHLVLHQGTNQYGEQYLALKLLGKAVAALEHVEEGDTVRCSVEVRSSEARNGSGKWYTDALCFFVKVEEKGAGRRDENEDPGGGPDGDDGVPF